MKRILFVLLLCPLFFVELSAQTMSDVLRTMPDSILPLLTKNDRLDLVDEWEAGVKAEVRNRLGGMVTLTELTATRAQLQMSSVSTVTLELVDDAERGKCLRLTHTVTAPDGLTDRRTAIYVL